MIQLAWRLRIPAGQRSCEMVQTRMRGAKGVARLKMIVGLARKLLIALWRMVNTGEIPEGVVLRQPA